jgi:protein-L-isoaspartate(D-aspartate) O-methyltransferase
MDRPDGASGKDDADMSVKEPDDVLHAARERMIRAHLQGRDITDPRVIDAMRHVPRHELVPASLRAQAYSDQPLPIGHGQTISQPYIVALMTQLAKIKPHAVVLDVGTGSGYQAAVLAEMGAEVYSIEIVPELARQAAEQLARIGYEQIQVRCGDGYRGWPEHAPFDAIIVAAAPEHIPQPLIDQLAPGGHLIIPVGSYYQSLIVVTKQPDGTVQQRSVASVAFVPMTGEAERQSLRD